MGRDQKRKYQLSYSTLVIPYSFKCNKLNPYRILNPKHNVVQLKRVEVSFVNFKNFVTIENYKV